MDTKELGTLCDSVMQINSLSTVCKEYTDNHCQYDEMLHVGFMVDKIHEQSDILKELLKLQNLLP